MRFDCIQVSIQSILHLQEFVMTRPILATIILHNVLFAQGTLADYQRAHDLPSKARLVVNVPGAITWIGNTDRFWYPRTVKGGTEFVLGDASAATKDLAFDHEKLAAAISKATGKTYKALALPFAPAPA